ncbi:uncharacterized protein BXZ73DRAFT_101112 [Epithele typhae]|uniref:uncharacterized protein n=1 Tax=Epithele typhae TaxID=378194 RepID=UPI002008764A|nr:uncharacterized protein BXZ73DRAFT_101112 [Epithele typhae]KAH9933145.1 hypothetical protein BXZ73DRAFT_101112 [Epithele typhae]
MADGSSQPPVPTETLLLIGPMLIGGFLSWMLFGVSAVQLYIYHVSFPQERPLIWASVYIIFILDLVQSVVVSGQTWDALVAGWGRPVNLEFPGWSITGLPLVSSIIALWVQTFFAWRILRLSRSKWIPFVILITGLAQAAGAWVIGISFIWLKNIDSLHSPTLNASNIIWLGGSAFTDVIIMLSMLYLLYSAKRKVVRFQRSKLMIRRLVRLTVETGCACALAAVLELTFFLALPNTNIHIAFGAILAKVYSNTLMTSLNSRVAIGARPSRSGPATSANISFMNIFSTHSEIDENQTASRSVVPGHPLQIHISHVTESDHKGLGSGGPSDKVEPDWDIEMADLQKGSGHGKDDVAPDMLHAKDALC